MVQNDDAGLSRYIRSIQRFQPLERDEEQALARRFRDHGDRKAADALIQSNLRYVVKIALSYKGYGLRVSDLVEEGNIGLCEAVRRFDPERNLRFMTYAAYWIRAYVLAHVLKQWSIVGVGTGPLQSKLFFRLARERAKLAAMCESEDTLASTFHTTSDRVRQMADRLEARDSSLDVAAFKDGEATMLDLLTDGRANQEDRYADAERAARIRAEVARVAVGFDAREKLILAERLLSEDETTLADLGRRLGLSRERVRQLEERVKQKLRRALEPAQAA
jgi:RNA polymerase sigma-32 factor